MKILHVISTFPPAFAFGGPARVAFDVCKELVKRGHKVEVYTTNAYDQKLNFHLENKQVNISGIKVTYFPNLFRMHNFYVAPEMITQMQKTLKNFDIVHVHFGRQLYDIYFGFKNRDYNVPYIIQAHGSLPVIGKKRTLKLFYDKFFGQNVLKGASKIIALNHMEAEQCIDMGVPKEKIKVIPNGIDSSMYVDLPSTGFFKKKFGIPEDKKIILYLGRLHKLKGIDFLIKSYVHLIKKYNIKPMLVIAGPDDGYLAEAKRLVNNMKVDDKVLFTGVLTETEKIGAYIDASICAYLGPNEPFGIVTLEAAMCGTPVIVSSNTPMAEIVEAEKFGFSVQYGNINDLAKIMAIIYSEEDLLKKIGRRGREYVINNYIWSKIIIKLEKVYEETVRN